MPSFQLTPAQIALLPDDADVASYEENGYYISQEGVVPDAVIDAASEGSYRFYEEIGRASCRERVCYAV